MDRIGKIRLKIDRAKEHIQSLDIAIGAFVDTKPYTIGAKPHPVAAIEHTTLYIASVEPIPASIALIVGDAIHNLRSALDHLAWQLVEAGGGTPNRDTYFPICQSAQQYASAIGKGELPKMRAGAEQVVRDLQPYVTGDDTLWFIHDLDRIDKHRLLITVTSSVDKWGVDVSKGITMWFDENRFLPLEVGYEISNLPTATLNDRYDRGQLWTISYPKGELRRLTNDLSDYGWVIDGTRDRGTLAAVAATTSSNIWAAPDGNTEKIQQITSGEIPLIDVLQNSKGDLLAWSADAKLWILNKDGTQRRLFTDITNVGAPSACGHFVLFGSSRTGSSELTRVDDDGTNATTLVRDDVASVACAVDGSNAFYTRLGTHKILRVAPEGGIPVEIGQVQGDGALGGLAVSPDGKLLAYQYLDDQTQKAKLAIISSVDGRMVTSFNGPEGTSQRGILRWSPDGRRLQFLWNQQGATNIWEQPIAGAAPLQLTRFTSGQIFDFNWSPDGQRLLLTRGDISGDVVLLSNLS